MEAGAVGGLVGRNYGSITNSSSTASVASSGSMFGDSVGGLVGWRGIAIRDGCRGLRIVERFRAEQVAQLGRRLAAAQEERAGERRHQYTTLTLTHRYTRPGRRWSQPGAAKANKASERPSESSPILQP